MSICQLEKSLSRSVPVIYPSPENPDNPPLTSLQKPMQTPRLIKSTLVTLGVALTLANFARGATFTPIPLNPSSFNADPVIEASAPRSLNDFVNVTPDAGTNKTGNTWYEIG